MRKDIQYLLGIQILKTIIQNMFTINAKKNVLKLKIDRILCSNLDFVYFDDSGNIQIDPTICFENRIAKKILFVNSNP